MFDNALSSQAAAHVRAVCFCLIILATRKRVYKLFECQLVVGKIFRKLILYVFRNNLFIAPYGIYIVSSAPKVSGAIFVLQICMSVEYH